MLSCCFQYPTELVTASVQAVISLVIQALVVAAQALVHSPSSTTSTSTLGTSTTSTQCLVFRAVFSSTSSSSTTAMPVLYMSAARTVHDGLLLPCLVPTVHGVHAAS